VVITGPVEAFSALFRLSETLRRLPLFTHVDRYLLGELLNELLLGLALFTLIGFFSDTFLDFLRDIQRLGIPMEVAFRILWLQLPGVIVLVLPASVFFATVMVLSRLNQSRELLAFQNAGLSLWRISLPIIAIGVLTTVINLWITNGWVPESYKEALTLKHTVLKKGPKPQEGKNFILTDYSENHQLKKLLFIGAIKNDRLENIILMNVTEDKDFQLLHAAEANWGQRTWNILRTNAYHLPHDSNIILATNIGAIQRDNPLELFFKEEKPQMQEQFRKQDLLPTPDGKLGMLGRIIFTAFSFPDLLDIAHVYERAGVSLPAKYYLKMWDKVTLPASTLIILMCALPLCLQPPRRVGDQGFVLALATLFGFYLCRAIIQAGAQALGLSPVGLMIASWLPIFFIGAFALFLMAKRSRPSEIR